MNNSDDEKTRWASIRPSARRSIHSQASRPSYISGTMGRFGLSNERENRAQTSNPRSYQYNDQDIDEVDNVFSKPIHSISPQKHMKNKPGRRNSFDFETDDGLTHKSRGEDDESDILSKSLPATLPSRSYCSDSEEEDIRQQDNVHSDYSFNTSGSRSVNRTPTATHNMHLINRTTQTSGGVFNRSPTIQSSPKSPRNEAKNSIGITMSILVTLAGVLMILLNMYYQTNTSVKEMYDESRFYSDIDLLGNRYRIGDNAILLMQTGISTILKRQDTGSFMFVYDSRGQKYNQEKFNTFINNISETTSKYLRNQGPVHYTMVEGSTLNMRDHGELINRFQHDLDRTGVMLVKDVEAIPSDLAMAFHYYCDEYNPLVKQSAIFFTLNLAECALEEDMKLTHAVIEKCLAQKWSGVPPDSIGPLLTRVVSVVIDLTSAF